MQLPIPIIGNPISFPTMATALKKILDPIVNALNKLLANDSGYITATSNYVIGAGTSDAITATFTPAFTTLVDGLKIRVRATAANTTTTPTFKLDSNSAKTIVKNGGGALSVGYISSSSHELELVYNSTLSKWVMIN